MDPAIASVVVGFLTLIGVVINSWLSNHAKKSSAAVNDAVNNRHPDHPKLYDLALDNQRNIRRTRERIDEVDFGNLKAHDRISGRLEDAIKEGKEDRRLLREDLERHIQWEEQDRYPQLENDVSRIKDIVKQWENPEI